MEVYKQAAALPGEWDDRREDNYSLKRRFLSLLEKANPCDQTYYIFRSDKGQIDSILVTYLCKKMNLFMFTPLNIYLDVTFVHVPVSITRPGFVIGKQTKTDVYKFINSLKGFVIILNMTENPGLDGFAPGRTCSQIRLLTRWDSFDDYLQSMRKHYRYYYKKAMKKVKSLTYRMLSDNKMFDDRLYALYAEVHARSRIKLEKLGIEFFKADMWKIFVFEKDNIPIGFIQLFENNKHHFPPESGKNDVRNELVFEFIGMDYRYNQEYDLYTNLLLKIVEYGISHGFEVIEFGQTTEEMKLKLGSEYRKLYALVHHSHPVINWVMGKIINFISYKPYPAKFHVFKKEVE